MTKKPVKKLSSRVKKQLDMIENTELWGAIKRLEERVSTTIARVDGAWGKITTLESQVHRESMYPPGFAAELTARSKALLNQGQFCVIGDKAYHQYPISRKWHPTAEEAEQYAASLVRNQSTTTELLVVQVVSKVGRKEPDIKITRI